MKGLTVATNVQVDRLSRPPLPQRRLQDRNVEVRGQRLATYGDQSVPRRQASASRRTSGARRVNHDAWRRGRRGGFLPGELDRLGAVRSTYADTEGAGRALAAALVVRGLELGDHHVTQQLLDLPSDGGVPTQVAVRQLGRALVVRLGGL